MSDKSVKRGFVDTVLATLRGGESRQFPLRDVNVASWRSIVSKKNRQCGYKRYSVTISRLLGFLAVKNNDES